MNSLTDVDPTNPVTIAIDLGGQTITTDTQINAPAGVTVVIQDGTLVGGSPALVVDSGNVVLDNVTAINATNAPTIVVNGGSLTLRGSTIQGSSAAPGLPAILITGGSVDLGASSADPGNNTIIAGAAGELVHNNTAALVPEYGDTLEVNGRCAQRADTQLHHAGQLEC